MEWVVLLLKAALTFFSEKMNLFLKMLTTDLTTYNGGGMWQGVENIYQALLIVGLSLANIFVWVELIESTSRWAELRKSSVLITFVVEIVVVNALMYYGKDILITVYSIGQGITRGVMEKTGMINASGQSLFNIQVSDDFVEAVGRMNISAGIALLIVIIIVSAWICVSTIAVLLTVYVRIFNLYILIAVSPLAFACAMSKRTRFVFENFCRTFASVTVEAVVLVLVMYLFSQFFSSGINIDMTQGSTPSSDTLGWLLTLISPTLAIPAGGLNPANVTSIFEYLITMAFLFAVMLGMVKGSENLVKRIFGL
ncbi:MAG: type IV secretion system protein [Eubacterium sp.]|nr:type IV secretion system protein [Eubacterium sp.]